ncbi:MAG: SpoIIE family protein phosphatase [Treponema sp.]|jgi:serine phosphatase RsbU (regulator of sigma subunit)|nr:SpoIIE family protein phosphatase [Treponema sp.]
MVFALLCFADKLFAQTTFYWEDPLAISPGAGTFPVSASRNNISVVAWQETEITGTGRDGIRTGQIRVSAAVNNGQGDWVVKRFIGGPYQFSGPEPSILSAAVDNRGRIFIAAAASADFIEILRSEDAGESFAMHRVRGGSGSTLAPKIFTRADGGYFLFTTHGTGDALSLYFSRSRDGIVWEEFTPFVKNINMSLNFLPEHVAFNGRDYVVFQSFAGDENFTFQLYLTSSLDGGVTWTTPLRITSFYDPYTNSSADPGRFDNQRPHLSVQQGRLFLVWERRYTTENPLIYGAYLNANGFLQGSPQRLSQEGIYCNNPIAFEYQGQTTVVWFDNRYGQNRVFLAQYTGVDWQNRDMSGTTGTASFVRPVVNNGSLYLFWQSNQNNRNRILSLWPDKTVNSPSLVPLSFQAGRSIHSDSVRISWQRPYDSSGITGYSTLWSPSPTAVPGRNINVYADVSNQIEETVSEDGSWYFSVRARDFAGNWSEPSRIEFVRDTTPPSAAIIIPPELDENGYLTSNTFNMQWDRPAAPDVAGYTWSLVYQGSALPYVEMNIEDFDLAMEAETNAASLSPRIMGSGTSASYTNRDNGLWRFSVAPIDDAGNIGTASNLSFRTNKYIPYTYVTYVNSDQDEQGIINLDVIGRGFSDGGDVSRVFLDLDGQLPYDREFFLDRGDFSVLSDRQIGGIRIDDIDQGVYRLGVEHPLRGLSMTAPIVNVDETGTVKFGDFSEAWKPSWMMRSERKFVIDTPLFIAIGIMVFAFIGFVVSARGIGNVVSEAALIRLEAAALITGDLMPSEKKKSMKKIKRRGVGLRLKLASFTIVLVTLVVGIVSTPLYLSMTRTQEETLLTGLWDRSKVLLEGLASSTRVYLPAQNLLELGFLPEQTAAIPEADYVTITGFGSGSSIYNDYVWASNDPGILSKVNTDDVQYGVSRLSDGLSPRLEVIANELNTQARERVGTITESINALSEEYRSIALRTGAEVENRMNEIQASLRELENQVTAELNSIGSEIGSEPAFSRERLSYNTSRHYLFFKPVMYRQGTEDVFLRGMIRLEVSIDSIAEQIAQGQQELIRVILLVALSAIGIGILGALVMSAFIISPLKKLVAHVEVIRDTEDKAKLEGLDVNVKTQDEIAVLGKTINDMTHGLVKAAQASQDMTIGKEVQKKFIPLEVDREGNKLSSGAKDTKFAHFFGYYEGAKGVSGDYFDYQDLDGRYYAIIKCDVAGKGIPAALIMIQVATMFLNYFKNWKPTEKGMQIQDVVYQINDFIETLAFKGRFAAFTLCLFDSETGIVRFCNAGDNIVHLYNASEKKVKTITLPETPATGVLPNFMVESKGGYTVETLRIGHGDILLLYTDGIEEAKRKFRNAEFKEILCEEGGSPVDTPHETHSVGQGDEEMGPERVEGIINAVMNREVYSLYKYHNPEGEIHLQFDFSSCEGTVEEAIMAMVSVEKMFRAYKPLNASEDNRVLVDKKVDAFLKDHFRQYRNYCSFTKEAPDENYLFYTHLKEDDQYDDLTILGITRK